MLFNVVMEVLEIIKGIVFRVKKTKLFLFVCDMIVYLKNLRVINLKLIGEFIKKIRFWVMNINFKGY